MKRKSKTLLILIFLSTILTLYLLNSQLIISSILDYTKIFLTKLFPTNFLIYTITSLLLNYQIIEVFAKISKHPSILYVILMSLIGGFPSGPKHISNLYQKGYLSKKTSNYLLKVTHFPNPLFVLGSIASLVNSSKLAVKILVSLVLSNIITALISFKSIESTNTPKNNPVSFPVALNEAILASFNLQLLIYGTNLFFYLISIIITKYLILSPLPYILINGTFDLIKGIFSSSLISSSFIQGIIIVFFLSFGSISIHIQIKSIISDASLNYKSFFNGRLLATFLSVIIFIILHYL